MISRILRWLIMVYMIAWWVISHMETQGPATYILDALIFLGFTWCFYLENEG